MQNKILFFILIALSLNLTVTLDYQLGRQCNTKRILDDNRRLIYDAYSDHKSAFNGISSCASLRSDQKNACCYIKVKFNLNGKISRKNKARIIFKA